MLKDELLRKIYLTRKSRILASERLNKKDTIYQLLVNYYSLFIVAISIWNLQATSNSQVISIVLLIASITLSLFSLFISSRNYKERYFNLKNNYIDLDELYVRLEAYNNNDIDNILEIHSRYNRLLKLVENHTEFDYICVMYSSSDERKKLNWLQISQVFLFPILNFLKYTFYFLIPIIIIYLTSYYFMIPKQY